jgi:hypothetical protein
MLTARPSAFASFPASWARLAALFASARTRATGSAWRTVGASPLAGSTAGSRSSAAFGFGGIGLNFGLGFLFGCRLCRGLQPSRILLGLLLLGGFEHGCYRLGRFRRRHILIGRSALIGRGALGGSAALIR